MKAIRLELRRWIENRRAEGFNVHFAEIELWTLVHLLEARGATRITNKIALEWATSPDIEPATRYGRFMAVRGFTKHLQRMDPRTEVLPPRSVPRPDRKLPYIYSGKEIERLLSVSLGLNSGESLKS